MTDAMPLGYRIVGPCDRERRLVDYDRAFAAYAACDDRAQIELEGFLSPFQYDDDLRTRIIDGGGRLDVRGYAGRCWSRFLWFDIDRDGNIEAATNDTRALALLLVERYRIDDSELLVFFSGSKGYHVGLPTSLFIPAPDVAFHRVARRMAEGLAASAGVSIDTSVYSKVQPLRAANSRHGKTGRHKRFVAFDELLHVRPSAIVAKASEPIPFDIPDSPPVDEQAVDDWRSACRSVNKQAEAVRNLDGNRTELNRLTFDVIAGDAESPRRTAVYSAAANLAEFGCPARLAHALLTPGGLDCGLPPLDVRRAIDNGLNKGGSA